MVSIKKSRFIIVGLICMITIFTIGFLFGQSSASDEIDSDLPQNIKIDAKALIKQITIKEVNVDNYQYKITFVVTINSDMHELIDQKIINTIYNVPISGEVITSNNEAISLGVKKETIELDFSKDSTFDLYFNIDEQIATDIINNIDSINVKFILSDDPLNVYEYVTSYIYED